MFHGIITEVFWLPNQVVLVVEASHENKIVTIMSGQDFVDVFAQHLIGSNDTLSVSKVKGMWVDFELNGEVATISNAYSKLVLLNERVEALVPTSSPLPPAIEVDPEDVEVV